MYEAIIRDSYGELESRTVIRSANSSSSPRAALGFSKQTTPRSVRIMQSPKSQVSLVPLLSLMERPNLPIEKNPTKRRKWLAPENGLQFDCDRESYEIAGKFQDVAGLYRVSY
jgi:hypothetical protein